MTCKDIFTAAYNVFYYTINTEYKLEHAAEADMSILKLNVGIRFS